MTADGSREKGSKGVGSEHLPFGSVIAADETKCSFNIESSSVDRRLSNC